MRYQGFKQMVKIKLDLGDNEHRNVLAWVVYLGDGKYSIANFHFVDRCAHIKNKMFVGC